MPDYFTNTFLDTQKGEKVTIGLAGKAKVITDSEHTKGRGIQPLIFRNATNGVIPDHDKYMTINTKGEIG